MTTTKKATTTKAPAKVAAPVEAPKPTVKHTHCAKCGYSFKDARKTAECRVPAACAKRSAANAAAGRKANDMGYTKLALFHREVAAPKA